MASTATADVTPTSRARPRALYTRIAVFGLLAVVVALVGFWASTGFSPDELAFIAPFMIAPAIVALLAWRFGTWAKVLTAVIGLALLVMNAPFLLPAMARPQVFVDFTAGATYLLGAAIALAGGVAAVVKRADLRTVAAPTERRIEIGATALIVLLAVVSGVLALTTRTTATAADRAGAIAATMQGFAFDQATYTAAAGEDVRFVVHNSDQTWHTFTIDDVVDHGVVPASDAVIELPALEAGTYTIYCQPHSHRNEAGEWEGMTAQLVVR